MNTHFFPKPILAGGQASWRKYFARALVLRVFIAVAATSFLLRIFYAGHLYQDDGLWFTAAEEILRGHALYREIYFDKPPAAALLYALLFKLFGAHILTIRLFTVLYSVAVSWALYMFGRWLYDRRTGLLAAAMFAVFSTTYTTGHVQGLNTDFLMTLPNTAAAFLLARSRVCLSRRTAFIGGALVGVAFQVNPKGVFALIFFAILLIAARRWFDNDTQRHALKESLLLFVFALAGTAVGSLPFLAYIAWIHSLTAYWLYVWDWGRRYADYYPLWKAVWPALTQSMNYFLFNNTLLVALLFIVAITIKNRKQGADGSETGRIFASDVTMLIWFAVSYAGLSVGGRFFGHYFLDIMPVLCLIGARGLTAIISKLRARSRAIRIGAVALLILGFLFTLERFHGRTITLATDWVRGTRSEETKQWFHERLKREERMAAALVRELPEGAESADLRGLEDIRADGPRTRPPRSSEDYLFVWGYRPELYYWSGLLPASRYLSSQPLTGVPADVHYFSDYSVVLDEDQTSRARAELLSDLEQTRPKYIIDELGFFNADLDIQKFSDLRELMKEYKNIGSTGRFIIYRKKDLSKKKHLRQERKGQ